VILFTVSSGHFRSPDIYHINTDDNIKYPFQSQPLLVEEHEDNVCKTISLESNRRECLKTPKCMFY